MKDRLILLALGILVLALALSLDGLRRAKLEIRVLEQQVNAALTQTKTAVDLLHRAHTNP